MASARRSNVAARSSTKFIPLNDNQNKRISLANELIARKEIIQAMSQEKNPNDKIHVPFRPGRLL